MHLCGFYSRVCGVILHCSTNPSVQQQCSGKFLHAVERLTSAVESRKRALERSTQCIGKLAFTPLQVVFTPSPLRPWPVQHAEEQKTRRVDTQRRAYRNR